VNTTYETDIAAALVTKLKANLTAIRSGWIESQNVAWPGVHFPAAGKSTFMAVGVHYTKPRQAAIGTDLLYIEGELVLEFFGQQGQDGRWLYQSRGSAQAVFPMRSTLAFGSGGGLLTFRAPWPEPAQEDDNEWLLGRLTCPFYTYT
jgi:hypothetical protein